LLVGAAVAVLFGCLVVSARLSVQPVVQSLDHAQAFSEVMTELLQGRVQIESYLASGSESAFVAGEAALEQAIAEIEARLMTDDTGDAFALQRLEAASVDYLNLIRSLNNLQNSDEHFVTTQTIRQQIAATAVMLDQAAQPLLLNDIATAHHLLSSVILTVTQTGIVVLLILSIIFAVSFVLVSWITRRSRDALRQVGQAAQQIALGNYDFRIDAQAANNPDVAELVVGFNRMAKALKNATEAETTASRQNGLQMMKLAQQERMTAVLEERQRIARELHDSVKQQLFSITLSASASMNLLEHSPELARTHLQHIRQAGHTAQTEMTALLQELIPVSLQEKRLEDALLSYLKPLCEVHGIQLLWRVDGTNTLTIAEEHALLRAAQEATANVIRHSHASLLRVSFSFGLVTYAIIEDNGVGFIPETIPATSTGLALMRTRLKRVGGGFQIESSQGVGTRLTISLDSRRTVSPRSLTAT
jgi:NarL family two-component system sensor histidine kinase LiaS